MMERQRSYSAAEVRAIASYAAGAACASFMREHRQLEFDADLVNGSVGAMLQGLDVPECSTADLDAAERRLNGYDDTSPRCASFDRPVTVRTLGELRSALSPFQDNHRVMAGDPSDLSELPVLITLVRVRRGDGQYMIVCFGEDDDA